MIKNNSFTPAVPEILSVNIDRKENKIPNVSYNASSCGIFSIYMKGGPAYKLDNVCYEFKSPVGICIPSSTLDQDLQKGEIWGICLLFKYHPEMFRKHSLPGHGIFNLGEKEVVVPMLKPLNQQTAENLVENIKTIKNLNLITPTDHLKAVGLLFQIISEFIDAPDQSGKQLVHREAERLKNLIDEFAYEYTPMSKIYRELNISASHAEALFSKAYGLSPASYRIKLRMNRARELLVSTRMNVSETSFEVGINDPLYFSRIFKKHFGLPPSKIITDFKNTRK